MPQGGFVENRGQLGDPEVLFYQPGDGMTVLLATGWVAYQLHPGSTAEGWTVRVAFECAAEVAPVGTSLTGQASNFLLGRDPEGWVRGARSYDGVAYRGLWDGVDLVFRTQGGELKYDLLVGPYAGIEDVSFSYEGATGLSIEAASGDLVIETPVGSLRDLAPVAHQGGVPVHCAFDVKEGHTVGFLLGDHDPGSPLVIDPGISFGTYLGGPGPERIVDTWVDPADGSTVLLGVTNSTDFPSTPGAYQESQVNGSCFVAKLSEDGSSLIWSTFLGGNGGDFPIDLWLHGDGKIYVYGQTDSQDFPVTIGAYDEVYNEDGDTFVAKLSEDGSDLIWSTYLGGSSLDCPEAMAVDEDGRVHLAGWTWSSDFPTTADAIKRTLGGKEDCTYALLSADGSSLVKSTYVGGSDDDRAGAMVLHTDGTVYIVGDTKSTDFPVTPLAYDRTHGGAIDAFLMRFDPSDLTIKFSSYLGGTGTDMARAVALDEGANVYVAGSTGSTDFPTTSGVVDTIYRGTYEGFVTKVYDSGNRMWWSTYIGGSGWDSIQYLEKNPGGALLFAGSTTSSDLQVTSDAYDAEHGGSFDAMVGALAANGTELLYLTYLGGTGDQLSYDVRAVPGGGFRVSGSAGGEGVPTTPGAYQTTAGGGEDGYVIELGVDRLRPPPAPENLSVELDRWIGRVELTWDPVNDTGALPLLGYMVYQSVNGSSFRPVKDTGTGTSYADRPEPLGVEYRFYVRARNAWGYGPPSGVVNVTPVSTPGMLPLLYPRMEDGKPTFSWDEPYQHDYPLLGYHVYRSTSRDAMELVSTLPADALYYQDGTPLEGGYTYYYNIVAFNVFGDGDDNTWWFEIHGPSSAPLNLTAEAGGGWVALAWEPPERGGDDVHHYVVLRGASSEALNVIEDYVRDTTYTDKTVTSGNDVYYAVVAVTQHLDESWESPRSNVVMVLPMGPPTAVQNLQLIQDRGKVLFQWNRPRDTGGSPILGYNVSRALVGEDPVPLATVPPDTFHFEDPSPKGGVTHVYHVLAYSELGEGPAETLLVTPLMPPGPPDVYKAEARSHVIELDWRPPEDDGGSKVAGYYVYMSTDPDDMGEGDRLDNHPLTGNIVGVTYRALDNGVTYYVWVASYNLIGTGNTTGMFVLTPSGPPEAPQNITVALMQDMTVVVGWDPPASDGGAPVTSYKVYRKDWENGTWAVIAEQAQGFRYVDTALVPGHYHEYSVSAVNANGESGRSPSEAVNVEEEEPDDGGDGGDDGSPVIVITGAVVVLIIVLVIVAFLITLRRGRPPQEPAWPEGPLPPPG